MTAPMLQAVRDDHQPGWTSETPQIVAAAFLAAEVELDRTLQPGDVAACCPGETLVAWPWSEQPALCCPGCGTLIPPAVEVAA